MAALVEAAAAVDAMEEEGLTIQVPFKRMNSASTRATAELLSLGFRINQSFAEPTQLLAL